MLLSLAVALIPIASGSAGRRGDAAQTRDELQGLVRLFAVILLIEVASLVGNYY